MAALAVDGDPQRAESLLRRTDQSDRTPDAGQTGGGDDAALVVNRIENDVLLLEIARYVQGALGPSDLLVEPEAIQTSRSGRKPFSSSASAASRMENSIPFMSSVPRP